MSKATRKASIGTSVIKGRLWKMRVLSGRKWETCSPAIWRRMKYSTTFLSQSSPAELLINQCSQVLLLRGALHLFSAQPRFVLGVARPMYRTLHLTFLNFMRFTWAHLSSLSRSLWMASLPCSILFTPHSLVSCANLLRLHSIPLSVLPTKMLKF